VYSLSGIASSKTSSTTDPPPPTNTTPGTPRRHIASSITSIQEDAHEHTSEKLPLGTSSPNKDNNATAAPSIKRTSSFSFSKSDQLFHGGDSVDGRMTGGSGSTSSSSSLKRSGSHGKLVNLYGSCTSFCFVFKCEININL